MKGEIGLLTTVVVHDLVRGTIVLDRSGLVGRLVQGLVGRLLVKVLVEG